MKLYYKIFKESLTFAIGALKGNLLRTILTLLGVTIGIFSIISVFTLIDYLESRVRDSVQSLGGNVVYVQKWPWGMPEGETEYPIWRYMNRPVPKLNEADEIMRRSVLAEASTFIMGSSREIVYGPNSYKNASIMGVSDGFEQIWSFNVINGRYFSQQEAYGGASVGLIGDELAKQLFQGENPIGKIVKMEGRKILIAGVFERQGEDMFGNSLDKNLVLPISFAKGIFNIRSDQVNPFIMVKGKPGVSSDDLNDELTGVMRNIRRLAPSSENDFALNRISIIEKNFDSLFSALDIAGWFIGGFSILVGGFGIANIMFVSVKERTRIIGIQKALGAKRLFILIQFLFESVFISLLGGVAGLFILFILTLIANQVSDTGIFMTLENILTGLMISSVIGILSGFLPALSASRLSPVDAMNTV
jgi:putative ABC transport system permease protein